MAKNERPYTIDLPRGWEDQTVFTFKGPDADGEAHLLMMTVDRHLQAESIEEFTRAHTVPILGALDGVEVLKHEEITVERGNPAWEFIYKWVPAEGANIIQMYVFVIADKTGFAFSIRFSKKTYQLLGRQVRDLIEDLLPGTYESPEDD